jgi:hypothetical protein
MKLILFFLIHLTFSINNSFSNEINSSFIFQKEELKKFDESIQFLERIGFYPFTNEIKESLKSPQLSNVSKKVLAANLVRYKIIDDAKELSSLIFATINSDSLKEKKTIIKIEALIEYLLLNKKNIDWISKKNESENLLKSFDNFEKDFDHQFMRQKELLHQVIVEIIPSISHENIQHLDRLISDYLSEEVSDFDLKQSHFLGRAILANYIKLIRFEKLTTLETSLRQKLEKNKIYLDNFITSKLKYIDNNKKLITVELHKGDFANEYSNGAEAFYISIGTLPKGIKNKIAAQRNGSLGNLFIASIFPTPNREEIIRKKIETKKALTTIDKIQLKLLDEKKKIAGYSHVGIIDVLKDEESKIEMSWVWDIYPNSGLGGIRFLSVEGFSYSEEYGKVGFTHYSPNKFLHHAKKQIQKFGYREMVWRSSDSELDEDNNLSEIENSEYYWPTNILREELFSFLNLNEYEAKDWFENTIAPKVIEQFRSYLSGTNALAFANGFLNTKNAAYCSEVITLAFLQATNIDPQSSEDKFSFIVRIGKKMELPDLKNINFKNRVISPSGFAWQADLVDTSISIVLPKQIPIENTDLNFKILTSVLDKKVAPEGANL